VFASRRERGSWRVSEGVREGGRERKGREERSERESPRERERERGERESKHTHTHTHTHKHTHLFRLIHVFFNALDDVSRGRVLKLLHSFSFQIKN